MTTHLDKLTLSNKSKNNGGSEQSRLRQKLVERIQEQIEAAEAHASGQTYIKRAPKWVDDPETGERTLREMTVRFSPWWFRDETGKLNVAVKYGNKWLELKPKKPSIEVGEIEQLVPTLQTLMDAVLEGELDAILQKAVADRKAQFSRSPKAS